MGIRDRRLSVLFCVSLAIMAIFFMAVSEDGYCTSPPPTISANLGTAPGMSITVSGQNFTPNGTAILYNNESYTANVDETGNTSWTYTNVFIAPYQIYAIDVTTNNKSNTLTIKPQLNDYPPTSGTSPTPSPFLESLFVLLSICTTTLIYILKKKSPPFTK